MASQNDTRRFFRLYVTHVDGEGHFLKISGQLEKTTTLMLEALFNRAREDLDNDIGSVPPGAIHEGIICAAKCKDGMYYRAKIINTSKLKSGLVGVHFIDFGNRNTISLSTICFLDSYEPCLLQLPGQASDYYLAKIIHPRGQWEKPHLLKLRSLLCYEEYPITVELQTHTLPMISIQFKGNDLSTHLVSNKFGVAIPLPKQEDLLLHLHGENVQMENWQPNIIRKLAPYTQHKPSFPQQVMIPPSIPPPQSQTSTKSSSKQSGTLRRSHIYKSHILEVNSQHKVFVSFAENGPALFTVQLVSEAKKLQDMMKEINKRPYRCLTEPLLIGTACLGRICRNSIMYRAIVVNKSENKCKLLFIDFGDTESVSYYDIFDIPEEFLKLKVFAMRFCLSKVKTLNNEPQLIETFKQIVRGKILTLRVVPPEGPPLIQYGELYLDNKNVLDLLTANMMDKLQFKWMEMLALGSRHSVLVSYVNSCIKFFVQLSDNIDELNAIMDKVKLHCENSSSPGALPVGAACCAKFPDDNNWYRALVKDIRGNKALVAYVDYGNEQEVDISHLRTITPDLLQLPVQALKCALKSFENKPVEMKMSKLLEILAIEKTLMANVIRVLSNNTMLISLVDNTVNPPLDMVTKMNQLSQPRRSNEIKATTPNWKDGPDSFSWPKKSVPDDSRRKRFRREKSFKDDRRSYKDGNDEFARRGCSFNSRDYMDAFDRPGSSGHSERFSGGPDNAEGDYMDAFDRPGPSGHSERFSGGPDNAEGDYMDAFDRPGPSGHSERFSGGPDRNQSDYMDAFDRPGPSGHSERFSGGPDRNQRRKGPKPPKNGESHAPSAATSDDGHSSPPPTNRPDRYNSE